MREISGEGKEGGNLGGSERMEELFRGERKQRGFGKVMGWTHRC